MKKLVITLLISLIAFTASAQREYRSADNNMQRSVNLSVPRPEISPNAKEGVYVGGGTPNADTDAYWASPIGTGTMLMLALGVGTIVYTILRSRRKEIKQKNDLC